MASSVTREQVMNALLGLLQGSPVFRTVGRRVPPWTEVKEQPAAFLRNVGEEWEQRTGQLPRRTLKVQIWLYSRVGRNPDAAPAVALNNLIETVQALLAPSTPQDLQVNVQTLGRLVSYCRIEGEIELDPGDIDDQAKAVLPVRILLP